MISPHPRQSLPLTPAFFFCDSLSILLSYLLIGTSLQPPNVSTLNAGIFILLVTASFPTPRTVSDT